MIKIIKLSDIATEFRIRDDKIIELINEWQEIKNIKVLGIDNGIVVVLPSFVEEIRKQKAFVESFIFPYEQVLKSIIRNDRDYNQSYIYFLLDKSEIVYIGQTVDLKTRLNSHVKDKEFDQVAAVQVFKGYLNIAEYINIDYHNPRINTTRWGSKSFLKRILELCDNVE